MARLLIVDDNQDACEALALLASLEGHECRPLASTDRLLEEAIDYDPDVIFLDLVMPGMNGLEALKLLRGHPRFATRPIVAVTGMAHHADWGEAATSVGFSDYMVKPIDSHALHRILRPFAAD